MKVYLAIRYSILDSNINAFYLPLRSFFDLRNLTGGERSEQLFQYTANRVNMGLENLENCVYIFALANESAQLVIL